MDDVRIALLEEFHFGQDAILFDVTSKGLDELLFALAEVTRRPDHVTVMSYGRGKSLKFVIANGPASVAFDNDVVTWTLSKADLNDLIRKATVMSASPEPCHNYLDIESPVDTVVLSKDEYR